MKWLQLPKTMVKLDFFQLELAQMVLNGANLIRTSNQRLTSPKCDFKILQEVSSKTTTSDYKSRPDTTTRNAINTRLVAMIIKIGATNVYASVVFKGSQKVVRRSWQWWEWSFGKLNSTIPLSSLRWRPSHSHSHSLGYTEFLHTVLVFLCTPWVTDSPPKIRNSENSSINRLNKEVILSYMNQKFE